MKNILIFAVFLQINLLALTHQCQTQTVQNGNAEICLKDYGHLKHWIFSLKVDNQLIFELVDDFSENVSLTHKIPKGLVIELPLSSKSIDEVTLTGGCKPVSENGTEIARICNFTWGDIKIIDNVKFVHNERKKLPMIFDINKRVSHAKEFNSMYICFSNSVRKYKYMGNDDKLYSKILNECACELKNIQQFYGFEKASKDILKDRDDPAFLEYGAFLQKASRNCASN